MNMMERCGHIIDQFSTDGECFEYKAFGNGHINSTFLISCRNAQGKVIKYVLQAINTYVFKEPDKLMDNIIRVTDFLRSKEPENRGILNMVRTRDGEGFYRDDEGKCWRMYVYVDKALSLESVGLPDDFYEAAFAFGKFQRDLSDFPAETLYEIIPDFHNTEKRYKDFLDAVERDEQGRVAGVKEEIEFIKNRAEFYGLLNNKYKEGLIPLRVTHNDTKLNNVLLDKITRKALCVLDLDTIMPGFSVTDFGDAIRFGANNAAEDEKDLSKVWINLELFKVYTEGYLEGCGGKLENEEIMLLPEGAKMMTIECGMRFLADYLDGDLYFKTSYPKHNLVRARTQLKLVEDMEKHFDEMKAIVREYCR